ncbi:hypothetical protein [Streptosporangium vulgare]|uniref:Uncharacterized protein n=1 Tax=Streptosporangium vulgare TaxID=46190 RepID=A0ABV5TS79_9ACTN
MRQLTRRNVVGVGVGIAGVVAVWVVAVYAGQILALVLAFALGLGVGLFIGLEIVDGQTSRELAGAQRDLALERERVTVLETTNATLIGKVAEHKQAARIAMETAANNLDRALSAEAHLSGGAQ